MQILRATVFVDWEAARRVAPFREPLKVKHLVETFEKLQNGVANYLNRIDRRAYYRVNWRMYHGWFQGKTKTPDRRLFDQYILEASSRTIGTISFGSDYSYGDCLSCGSARNPIFDTLRPDLDTGKLQQKMVDTALVCDLLHLVRTKDAYRYIVIADDDDVLPGIFTAEAWRANVAMLHGRDNLNAHLQTKGIAERIVCT